MPTTEDSNLGPDFGRRLKAALDEVEPPSPMLASARYRSAAARRSARVFRLAPALVGAVAAGAALTAAAATGSPNPVVWTQKAGSVISSVGHVPAPTPKPRSNPSPSETDQPGPGMTSGHPTPSTDREPSQTPEPTEKPETSPEPEPSPTPETSDHSGDGSTPSPTPEGDPEP